MKELVKKFQDCKEHVPYIEENIICENLVFNEEIEGKPDIKIKEEIKDKCVQIMEKKEKVRNRKKNGTALGKRVIKKIAGTGKENAKKERK